MRSSLFAAVVVVAVVFVSGCTAAPSGTLHATVYKSVNCGCCSRYIPYLQQHDVVVDPVSVQDISSVKAEHNVPHEMESCHTAVLGDYFVEGHVPMEAITKLLNEQPAIDGIALPGMPAGSPGMPGIQRGPFIIYAINGTTITEFMRI